MYFGTVTLSKHFSLLGTINGNTDIKSNMADKYVILGAVEGKNKDGLNFFLLLSRSMHTMSNVKKMNLVWKAVITIIPWHILLLPMGLDR